MRFGVVKKIRSIRSDRRANVAVTTALCAFPLLGIMGLGIDYALAISTKAKLDMAADAAVMAAITKAQTVIAGNGGQTGSALTDGQAQGLAAFKANMGSLPFQAGDLPTPTITVQRDSSNKQILTATVSYSATTQNQFGKLFNVLTTNIKGSSSSMQQMPAYKAVYMALDTSQSMGIAATLSDMQALYDATRTGGGDGSCVFGCHVQKWGQTHTNEYIAHHTINPSTGQTISLRIDVLRDAVISAVKDAQDSEQGKLLYTIGLYTIGGPIWTGTPADEGPWSGSGNMPVGLNTLQTPTNNLTTVMTAAAGINLGQNTSNGLGDTDFKAALANGTAQNPQAFNTVVKASGDGSTPDSPLSYAMIITDGLSDTMDSNGAHQTAPFDATICDSLKQKGVTVQVLYTQYLPIYSSYPSTPGSYDGNYVQYVRGPGYITDTVDKLHDALQSCASPTDANGVHFWQASDTASIQAAVKAMFAQVTQASRLTN